MSILITTQDRKMTVLVDSYYYVTVFERKNPAYVHSLLDKTFNTVEKERTLYFIKGFISSQTNAYKNDFLLGVYSSEEKAKRVLERINDRVIMIDRTKFFGCENEYYVDCIFEMPLDEEVKV